MIIESTVTSPRLALSDMDAAAAAAWAQEWNLPAYRGRQLYAAIAKRGAQSMSELTEFPKTLRDALDSAYRVRTVHPATHLRSPSDAAEKVLFALYDGATVETVLIPSHSGGGRQRLTVCVSSQVGCPAGCSFCATGLSGFGRNLSAAEIVDQVMYFAHAHPGGITNVVFMGMGEPLMNVGAVRQAVARLTDSAGFSLGARHITVSTVGIVPQIRRFADWAGQVSLAVSLHAPSDELRSRLVPYNRHFPIADLLDAVREYVHRTRRRVSFEYVLLRGVNDSADVGRELAALLRPFQGSAHVNLIPWNPFREGAFARSEGPDADAFSRLLRDGGVNTTIRYSKGLDISAACGQLRERVREGAV